MKTSNVQFKTDSLDCNTSDDKDVVTCIYLEVSSYMMFVYNISCSFIAK